MPSDELLNNATRRAATRTVTRAGKRRPVFDALLDDYDEAASALVQFATVKSQNWMAAREIKTLWSGIGEFLPDELRPRFPEADVCNGPVNYGGFATINGVYQATQKASLPIQLPEAHAGAYEWFTPALVVAAVKDKLRLRVCYTAEWAQPLDCPGAQTNCTSTLIMHTQSQYRRLDGPWVTVRDLSTDWGQVKLRSLTPTWWRSFPYQLIYDNWEKPIYEQVLESYWKERPFRQELLDSPTSNSRNSVTLPNADAAAQLVAVGTQKLNGAISDYYMEFLNDLSTIASPYVTSLTTYRVLIGNMVELALPRALYSNEKLASLVQSNHHLYDGEHRTLRELIIGLRDKRQSPAILSAKIAKRSNALRTVIQRYVRNIHKGSHREGDIDLQGYLARLDAVRRLIRLPVVDVAPRRVELKLGGGPLKVVIRNRSLVATLGNIRATGSSSAVRISINCEGRALAPGAACVVSLRLAHGLGRARRAEVLLHHSLQRNAGAILVRQR